MKTEEVEGIGPIEAEKLSARRDRDRRALLEMGAKPGGRAAIEKATGHQPGQHPEVGQPRRPDAHQGRRLGVLRPARGGRGQFTGRARPRNAANLATTFQEVDAARPDMVRRVPSETEVAGWIAEAKSMPKVVER